MDERDSDPGILLADRGYDSDAIREDVRDRGGRPEISTKRNRRVQLSVQRPLYALRNRIERCINRLKASSASSSSPQSGYESALSTPPSAPGENGRR